MHFYLLLVTLTLVDAGVVPDTKCDGVIIDGLYHEKETLKTGLDQPFFLAADYNTTVIYFSYYVSGHTRGSIFKSVSYDPNTKEFKDMNNEFSGGYGLAVDQNTHDVYIGGDYGIYKYDHKSHKSELYAATDDDLDGIVFTLFFKDVLYFIKLANDFTYTCIDGNIARFKDLEDIKNDVFVIDGEDDMFYSNDTGFYAQKKGGKDAVLYSKDTAMALTTDVNGNAYMCTKHAIYKINKMRTSVDKLLNVNDCWGIAFDGYNNMIYCDAGNLVRLLKIPKLC